MVGRDQFYAAFAGAKTTAFFCRACMERTMQLRDDVAVGLRQNDVQQYLCSQLAAAGDSTYFLKKENSPFFSYGALWMVPTWYPVASMAARSAFSSSGSLERITVLPLA